MMGDCGDDGRWREMVVEVEREWETVGDSGRVWAGGRLFFTTRD